MTVESLLKKSKRFGNRGKSTFTPLHFHSMSGERSEMALEDSDKILNVAGYWTLGIAKGVSMVFVPIMFMGLAAGFTMKVAQTAARVGGMK